MFVADIRWVSCCARQVNARMINPPPTHVAQTSVRPCGVFVHESWAIEHWLLTFAIHGEINAYALNFLKVSGLETGFTRSARLGKA